MNATSGKAQQQAMADLLTKLVEHRGAMQGMMMKMQPTMMQHLMQHMQAGDMGGMYDCPMMNSMQGNGDNTKPESSSGHSEKGRPPFVAILDDFQKVPPLLIIDRCDEPASMARRSVFASRVAEGDVMDHMDGYGYGGWMGLWWVGGITAIGASRMAGKETTMLAFGVGRTHPGVGRRRTRENGREPKTGKP